MKNTRKASMPHLNKAIVSLDPAIFDKAKDLMVSNFDTFQDWASIVDVTNDSPVAVGTIRNMLNVLDIIFVKYDDVLISQIKDLREYIVQGIPEWNDLGLVLASVIQKPDNAETSDQGIALKLAFASNQELVAGGYIDSNETVVMLEPQDDLLDILLMFKNAPWVKPFTEQSEDDWTGKNVYALVGAKTPELLEGSQTIDVVGYLLSTGGVLINQNTNGKNLHLKTVYLSIVPVTINPDTDELMVLVMNEVATKKVTAFCTYPAKAQETMSSKSTNLCFDISRKLTFVGSLDNFMWASYLMPMGKEPFPSHWNGVSLCQAMIREYFDKNKVEKHADLISTVAKRSKMALADISKDFAWWRVNLLYNDSEDAINICIAVEMPMPELVTPPGPYLPLFWMSQSVAADLLKATDLKQAEFVRGLKPTDVVKFYKKLLNPKQNTGSAIPEEADNKASGE